MMIRARCCRSWRRWRAGRASCPTARPWRAGESSDLIFPQREMMASGVVLGWGLIVAHFAFWFSSLIS
uniref:Uncharacterized protein n=1 Tax=Arundo donax TaxID=35708 RepID=A0A0A8ZQ36_ARUDO